MQKEKYRHVKKSSLSPVEILLFSDNRWQDTQQAKVALNKIRRKFLKEEELVLLRLKGMTPPKLDREVSELLAVSQTTANDRWRKLRKVILAYSWWLHNQDVVSYLVMKKLGPLHQRILFEVVGRKTQAEIAANLGITQWMVWKRMNDCLCLLKHHKGFEKFFKELKLRYHL